MLWWRAGRLTQSAVRSVPVKSRSRTHHPHHITSVTQHTFGVGSVERALRMDGVNTPKFLMVKT